MSFVPEHEAKTFGTEVIAFWSQLIKRDATSPLFHSQDLYGLSCAAPCGCSVASLAIGSSHAYCSHSITRHGHPPHPHATASRSTCTTTNHSQTTDEQACPPPQATWSSPPHQHHPEEACHPSTQKAPPQKTPGEPRHIPNLSSHPRLSVCAPHWWPPVTNATAKPTRLKTAVFACPLPGDSCCRTPAAPDPSGLVLACSQQKRSGSRSVAHRWAQQHHCHGRRYGGGVDRRHAAVTRCLADVIHNGTKVYIEQVIPALTRVVNGQDETCAHGPRFQSQLAPPRTSMLPLCHLSPAARPSLQQPAPAQGCLHCCAFLLQSVPSSLQPAQNQDLWPRERNKVKFDRYPHINLVPFILETTGRPGHHAKKVYQQTHERRRQPTTCHPGKTTTHSHSHVTLRPVFLCFH